MFSIVIFCGIFKFANSYGANPILLPKNINVLDIISWFLDKPD